MNHPVVSADIIGRKQENGRSSVKNSEFQQKMAENSDFAEFQYRPKQEKAVSVYY